MPDKNDIIQKCLAIAKSNFLNAPYKDISPLELYQADGIANKRLGIYHYCTIDVLNAILGGNCLRFTDVRFLNDSTEFLEVIQLIEVLLGCGNYSPDFKELILNSSEMDELKDYKQFHLCYSERTQDFKPITYHTYTCSFSTNSNSLSMWNYYAKTASGINIVFDSAENLFKGDTASGISTRVCLDSDIIICRGLVLYSDADKKKCVAELLDRLAEIFNEVRNDLGEYRRLILDAFKQSINRMRCFFKNEAFRCEEEYRAVLHIPEDLLQKPEKCKSIKKIGVFQRGNVLIPYVDYSFQKESINQITINPFIEPGSLFELGIENLLWMKGLRNIEIAHSYIPLRKYD